MLLSVLNAVQFMVREIGKAARWLWSFNEIPDMEVLKFESTMHGCVRISFGPYMRVYVRTYSVNAGSAQLNQLNATNCK